MTELLPTVQAANVRYSLVDYLTTTFALTDEDARDGLDTFLSDPVTGMFKGPYVRLRLPFRPAEQGWRQHLDWYAGSDPYGHQAAAFARLSSLGGRRPQPTLVTTGTGSGKTEAFLHPILDHARRARLEGVTGIKALILYPMNALANDQAGRLAGLLTGHRELASITAALYTGEKGRPRTIVTADGLITDRGIIRDTAPDILLTNYKMLDQLLLRHEDQSLWRQSATSLRYLVLDEFHTYDGAQGTDVAMLLRRLGLALKSHWRADDPAVTEVARSRPLGLITPVATSATLGDKGDPGTMLGFAETVFGEPFPADAVVTESRKDLAEWVDDAETVVAEAGFGVADAFRADEVRAAVEALGADPDGAALARTILGLLWSGDRDRLAAAGPELLLALAKAHPLVQELTYETVDAVSVDDLVRRIAGQADRRTSRLAAGGYDTDWSQAISAVVAALGHIRAVAGRDALAVDVHLWVRELTRIDRAADTTARFHWGDDGPPTAGGDSEDTRPSFPAVYCRFCGRSGWGVALAPVGTGLAADDEAIRRNHATREGRFRALLYAPVEANAAYDGAPQPEGLAWFSVRGRELLATPPPDDDSDLRDGWILPVLTTAGRDADEHARDDTCPSCAQPDGIRFLGSAIATLLSVSLSTLFGSAALDVQEKKALVFTDSVQDAAHRAGFVEARSHTLTLRAALNAAIAPGTLTLDALVEDAIRRTGEDNFQRYRLLGPDCVDRESFAPFWTSKTLRGVPARVMSRIRKRLALDVAMEFGLNSRTGRTLELTGAATVEVDAGPPNRMAAAARTVLTGFAAQSPLGADDAEPTDETLVRWVRGVLDRMRVQGAIDHPWFVTFRQEDGNRWSIWGGRPRGEGMPAFPNTRPAPSYPRVGGSANPVRDSDLDAVTAAQSWYARWTSRALSVSPADGGRLVRLLLDRLARDGVLITVTSRSGATVYAIPPSGVAVGPARLDDLTAGRHLLACDTCRALVPGSRTTVDQLDGAPCMLVRCHGRLAREALADNFYRRLYASPDMRRIVAREHTSLLDDATRLSYEDGFKNSSTEPNAPNVLVATPTLEMGIDIGDLSTVLLSSLPRTVASYLQRIGRAGRVTGNALNLAYLTGRGDQLPKLGDPLSVINGEVRPPATYLSAEEILRRQFTACLVDGMARDDRHTHPNSAQQAIGSTDPGSFLGELIAVAETGGADAVHRFTDTVGPLPDSTVDALTDWVNPVAGVGTSLFAGNVHAASRRWQQTVETLKRRQTEINKVLPELEAKAASPAVTDDDKRALRSARTTRKLIGGQLGHLRGEYWISVLEEHGLLPNYTLLDDTVTLAVGISWTNPDSGEFESDSAQFQRGSAQAIREFAPGAIFYARGWEIAVDAIDLGIDGESIRPWVFCPACGYAADIAATGQEQQVAKCPRCGSTGIADTGQRLDVVELSHVSAEVRRDEVKISDRRDQRDRIPFQLITAADIDPAGIAAKWFAENTGLGCTYLRTVDLRWLNVGVPGHGTSRIISADERAGALFRVCSGCGKLDTDSGRNRPHEHRAWCPYRKSTVENTTAVALSRTLRTQGLLLRLPYAVTLGDDFAVPSLAAAVLLGLREQIGGHPDHLRVEHVVDPTLSDGTDNHDALLLHDVVPGGTGYLADLADPQQLRDLLARAWRRVHDCECRHEERLACHRCLLPFTPPAALRRTSRAAAERHLAHLLGLREDAATADGPPWTIVQTPPEDSPESHLEQRFRQLIARRLKAIGAATTEVPKPWGNALRFTLPGDHRQWTLTPQVHVENSRPDFLLESNDTSVPAVAVFTDGHAYHAVASRNRLAEDAEKRQILRDTGRIVLAVTAADLAAAEQETSTTPAWFAEATVAKLIKQAPFQAAPSAYEGLRSGPISWLLAWVSAPKPADLGIVARAVPMFLVDGRSRRTCGDGVSLASVGRAALLAEELPPGERTILVRQFGALAVVVEPTKSDVHAALVLDDREQALDAAHADAWRLWLQLSNAMSLRDWPTVITTTSRVGRASTATATPEPAGSDRLPDGVDESWVSAYESAAPGAERDLIRLLAVRGGLEAPLIGVEGPQGIPVDISWPHRHLAVDLYDMPDEDRADLSSAGWRVVQPDPEVIVAALTDTTDRGER
uniref:Helicase superfamily 1 and 2 ATP-binding n=1 Tax=Salinispora arenicola (strain CNS-205) TaxID=391037 RepID=A8M876_SALAI